jgi:hypothetical protein
LKIKEEADWVAERIYSCSGMGGEIYQIVAELSKMAPKQELQAEDTYRLITLVNLGGEFPICYSNFLVNFNQ